MRVRIDHIIRQLKEIRNGKPWIYDTFEIKFNDPNEENAFSRPLPTLHSAAEIMQHLISWRKVTIEKLLTGKGEKIRDDWTDNEKLEKSGWARLLEDFDSTLDQFIEVIESKQDEFLETTYYDADYQEEKSFSFIVEGMLHHDLYHMGQLGLVIKFLKERSS